MLLPHHRAHAHTAAHTNTHILTPRGTLISLTPSRSVFSPLAADSLVASGESPESLYCWLRSPSTFRNNSTSAQTHSIPACWHTHTQKYTSMCTTVSLTLNRHACGALKHVTHKRDFFFFNTHTHTHAHTHNGHAVFEAPRRATARLSTAV